MESCSTFAMIKCNTDRYNWRGDGGGGDLQPFDQQERVENTVESLYNIGCWLRSQLLAFSRGSCPEWASSCSWLLFLTGAGWDLTSPSGHAYHRSALCVCPRSVTQSYLFSHLLPSHCMKRSQQAYLWITYEQLLCRLILNIQCREINNKTKGTNNHVFPSTLSEI